MDFRIADTYSRATSWAKIQLFERFEQLPPTIKESTKLLDKKSVSSILETTAAEV